MKKFTVRIGLFIVIITITMYVGAVLDLDMRAIAGGIFIGTFMALPLTVMLINAGGWR